VEYTDGQVLSFGKNREYALAKGFTIVSDLMGQVEREIASKLQRMRSNSERGKIAIDVSSMDRALMSRIILHVLDALQDGEFLLVLYCPSAFYPPSQTLVPIRHAGAAHPSLTGEITPPDMKRVALYGSWIRI
jgi:hypothetical protein